MPLRFGCQVMDGWGTLDSTCYGVLALYVVQRLGIMAAVKEEIVKCIADVSIAHLLLE